MKTCHSLLLLIFSSATLCAAPWGMTPDYENDRTGVGFGMSKIVSNQPVNYFIKQNAAQKPRLKNTNLDDKIRNSMNEQLVVINSFNAWFQYAAAQIKQSGRSAEFADIMPLLSGGVKLARAVSEQQADIIIHFVTVSEMLNTCGSTAGGCHWGNVITVPFLQYELADPENFESGEIQATLIHEIGHFLGLADQYPHANNASIVYSTSHRVGSQQSIMDMKGSLDCDDADGLLNIMDWTLAQENGGKYSIRSQKGWKTFCPNDNTVYAKAKVLNKPDFKTDQCIYHFTPDGDIASKQCPEPFVVDNRSVKYDRNGMPTELTDYEQNFSIIYFMFLAGTGEPMLYAKVHHIGSNKNLFTLRAQRDISHDYPRWNFPHQEDSMTVIPEADSCAVSHMPDIGGLLWEYVALTPRGEVMKFDYNFNKDAHKNYTGSYRNLLTDKKIDFFAKAKLDKEKSQPFTCSIGLDGTDKVLVYDEQGLVASDKETLEAAANRYGVAPQALVQAGAQWCNKNRLLPAQLIYKYKGICRFFYRIEDAYSKM